MIKDPLLRDKQHGSHILEIRKQYVPLPFTFHHSVFFPYPLNFFPLHTISSSKSLAPHDCSRNMIASPHTPNLRYRSTSKADIQTSIQRLDIQIPPIPTNSTILSWIHPFPVFLFFPLWTRNDNVWTWIRTGFKSFEGYIREWEWG
jgi:hypothetical protein